MPNEVCYCANPIKRFRHLRSPRVIAVTEDSRIFLMLVGGWQVSLISFTLLSHYHSSRPEVPL